MTHESNAFQEQTSQNDGNYRVLFLLRYYNACLQQTVFVDSKNVWHSLNANVKQSPKALDPLCEAIAFQANANSSNGQQLDLPYHVQEWRLRPKYNLGNMKIAKAIFTHHLTLPTWLSTWLQVTWFRVLDFGQWLQTRLQVTPSTGCNAATDLLCPLDTWEPCSASREFGNYCPPPSPNWIHI